MIENLKTYGIVLLLVGVLSLAKLWNYDMVHQLDPQPAQAAALETKSVYFPTVIRQVQTIFGIGVNQISTAGGFDRLTQTQSSWTRKDGVRWYDVEPSEGVRNWDVLDGLNQELLIAARNKIRVILIVQGTPQWAAVNRDSTCGPIREDKFPAFATFLHELVRRYSGPPYYIKDWEIWNEPDVDAAHFVEGFGCWGDMTDPYYGGGYYGKMLKAIYPAIKSADPQSRVILGGLLLDCRPDLCPLDEGHGDLPPKFLEGVLLEGAGDSFDGISFHAYDYYLGNGNYGNINWGTDRVRNGPVSIEKTAYIRELLFKYGVSDKFLLNTESALLCDDGCDESFQQTKASYVVQAYTAAIAQGLRVNLWYNMLGWRNSGLLTSDLQPLDAFRTYKFASEKIGDWQYASKVTESSGKLDGYELSKGNRRIMVMWSKDRLEYPFTPYKTPVAIYDAFGNSLPIATPLSIGQMPVYIEYIP